MTLNIMPRIHCRYGKYKWSDGSPILACEILETDPYFYRYPYGIDSPKKKNRKFAKEESIKSTDQFSQTTCRECRRSKAFHILKQYEIAMATPRNQKFSRRIWGHGPISRVQSKRIKCRGSKCCGQCHKHIDYYNSLPSKIQEEPKRQIVMSRTRPARIQPQMNEEEEK